MLINVHGVWRLYLEIIEFQEGVMGLAWTEHLTVGNAMIDSDHKKLFSMVNGIGDMLKQADRVALSDAFDQVEDWLCIHFAHEQAIAQAVKFPFGKNTLEHEVVLKDLCRIRDVIADRNGVFEEGAADYYCEFLSDWLTNHVLMEDMLMKQVLQTYPYDFMPCHA
jgi:hemerythrin